MATRDPERPHPVWAAVEVAVGSGLLVRPWWAEPPDGLLEWVFAAFVLLAGLAALGFAALNCLAMAEAPAGRMSVRLLMAALGLAVFFTVSAWAADGQWWQSVLPGAYGLFVARVAWREHRRESVPAKGLS